jgi:IclR family mhp operon transcriptional activator
MDQDSSIRSISRALGVLRAINRSGSLTLTEIAKAVEVPYATALRIVRALMTEGVVEREPDRKRYRPTALVQSLAYGFQNHDKLVLTARPHIIALTQEVYWPISIVNRVGNSMVVRDSTSTQTPLTFNHYYPGWQVPLTVSASGRAYLAHSPPPVRKELIEYFRADASSAELATLTAFEEGGEAEKIVAQGYAAAARTGYSANPGKTSSLAVPLFIGEELSGTVTLVFFAAAMPLADAVARFIGPMKKCAQRIGADMLKD